MPMTAAKFRSLALALPDAVESSHMNHPDFRVHGKIFATLGPGEKWGVVMLTPEQQASFLDTEPEVFQPANGKWGLGGATTVTLSRARVATVRQALGLAWTNKAPDALLRSQREP